MSKLSTNWVERSLKSVWHPCTQMQHHEQTPLIAVSHGRGPWLFDRDGHRYLDAISSWWVNLFGHANPRINEALRDQLDMLEHAMLAGFTHEPVVELSEQLAARTQHRLGHCFYASDGASAVEIALKMSAHYWRNVGKSEKCEFVCLQGSYHGETLGALAVTDVAIFREAYGNLLQGVHLAPSPDARKGQGPEPALDAASEALAGMRRILEQHHHKIAAVIVEPLVQCATGMAMHAPEYLFGLRTLCDEFQVHLIADEIAVGCGRTGSFFACEQADIWPDFLCLSKGISGGYLPLSLVMSTDKIYQAFYDVDVRRGFLHSHSYTGNPLACRAALATLAIFDDDHVLETNRQRATWLEQAFAPLAEHARVEHLRQRGMILAFDVSFDDAAKAAQFSRSFFAQALKQELLLRPIGKTVYVMPPYVLDQHETEHLGLTVASTLDNVLRELA